jgi:O-antigen ligase
MATAPFATRPGPLAVLGFFGLVLLALFFGLASALLPAWFIFAALLVPAVAALLLVRPEYAVLACMALVCGLIHPAFVPRVPVFGGALAAADATLAMLALYAVWTLATQPRQANAAPPAGIRLMAVALGLFGLTFAIAVVASLSFRGLNRTFVLGETRDLLYLLLLPVAVVVLRPHERQGRFVIGLVVLGCLFSVGQVLQGIFNIPVFGDQGISVLETLGRQDTGTTRATTLGLNVIIFSLLLTVAAYSLGAISKPLFFATAGLLMVGIVLTFGRTTFAAVLICLLVVVWWLNFKKLPQLIGFLVVVVGLGSAVGVVWKPDSFAAVYYRLTSIGEEIDHGYSAQWRFWEAEAMIPHIKEHPLIGVGLGADYKGASGSTLRPELNRYVHNAYLYMAGKMGVPALIFFLLFMACVFAVGRRTAKSDPLPWSRIVGAASAAMMIRFLLASITEPHFMSDYGVINIAIAGALVILSAQRRPPSDRATSATLTKWLGANVTTPRTGKTLRATDVSETRAN